MSRDPLTRVFVLLAGVLSLAGCLSKESPPTRYYVLEAMPATTAPLVTPGAARPLAVDLATLRLPRYLDRPQIVTRVQAGRLELDEYHQWGDNLAKNIQRVLARNLSLLLASSDVTAFTRRPSGPLDARVDIEIAQFERGPDGRVQLSAQWWLRPRDDAGRAMAYTTDLASAPLAATDGMDATVAAMSELLGRFSSVIATAIAAGVEP